MDSLNEYGTKAIQSELLPLLKCFHDFCVKHDVQYSLAYGSLLGAIRHKGFIPWDDDVDIFVSRDNFEKLKHSIEGNEVLRWDYGSDFSLWLARISMKPRIQTQYPPMIDVFILDNVPNNVIVARVKLFIIRFLQGSIKSKPDLSRFSFLMKICAYVSWLLGRLIPLKTKVNMYESVSKWANHTCTRRLSCYNTVFAYLGKSFSSSIISKYEIVPFEDTELSIMSGYHDFLSTTYGDYMTPPNHKVGHHLHPEYSISYK